MKRIRANITYANVISTLCLVLLLGGGTAYAASQLGKESVGTRQLKKEAVSLAKIKKTTIASLKGATGPIGPQGLKGEKGEKGATGDSTVVMRTGATVTVSRNDFEAGTASCLPGEKATGGGVLAENVFFPSVSASFPMLSAGSPEEAVTGTPTAWKVWVTDKDTTTQNAPATTKFTPYVICVS